MKKFLLFLILLPMLGFTQSKNVLSTFRVFPVPGKALEFKKALTAHIAKYHTTERKWRVFEVMSGPEAGAYLFIEGPQTWDEIEKSPKTTDAHTTDWDKTVEVFVSKTTNTDYLAFQEANSTVKQTDYVDNIILNHQVIATGMVEKAWNLMDKMKKVWVDGNESMAVYTAVASGEPTIVTSRRLKTGLKELDPSFSKPMAERYTAANGAGSWSEYLEAYSKAFSLRWSEHLQARPELSSK